MMATNPLEKSIRSAVRANDVIGDLFAAIGTADHPRGFVPSSYRQARRALKTALGEENQILALSDVFSSLRRTLEMESRSLLADAHATGLEEAARQLRFYGVETNPDPASVASLAQTAALDAVLAKLAAQEAAARAQVLTGAEPAQIIGDDERTGTLRPSDISAALATWAAVMVWAAFSEWVKRYPSPGNVRYKKQVVAALDNRTTECCLKAHGQVKPLDTPFDLTGEPRFADRLDWTPFHWYCRTSIALYLPDYDLGLTERMTNSAKTILNERAAGIYRDRHPADAFG